MGNRDSATTGAVRRATIQITKLQAANLAQKAMIGRLGSKLIKVMKISQDTVRAETTASAPAPGFLLLEFAEGVLKIVHEERDTTDKRPLDDELQDAINDVVNYASDIVAEIMAEPQHARAQADFLGRLAATLAEAGATRRAEEEAARKRTDLDARVALKKKVQGRPITDNPQA